MKQTHIPTAWQTGILDQVRCQAETLIHAYEALSLPKTPAEVERSARALLAIVRVVKAADSHSPATESLADQPDLTPRHVPNRQERRRLAAEARHMPDRLPAGTSP